jgi:hypothetical protein
MNTKDAQTPEEKEAVRKYMSILGKRAGEANKKKGSDYFKWVRSHRKNKETK